MVEINLLGEKSKRDWTLYNLIRMAVFLGCITVILMLSFSGALFAYNKKIQKLSNMTKESASSLNKAGFDQEEMNKEIEKINEKMRFFEDALKNHKEISLAIEELSGVLAPEIKVSSIGLQTNADKYAAIIKGNSSTRSDFLKLQSLMEKTPSFSNLDSPLSNITKKENIDFIITVDVKNNVLK